MAEAVGLDMGPWWTYVPHKSSCSPTGRNVWQSGQSRLKME